ncbi:MAG: RDD family protein [Actinomycetota bacterium]|nr:RDD family protein [Actinomycetota bacterium]
MEYEDRVTIATPEGVELELALAGLGSRSIAGLVDLLMKALLIGALAVALLGFSGGGGFATAAFSAAAFAAYFGYDIAFEVLGGGRTPGKRATGLRVVGERGDPVGVRRSAIRNLVRVIDGPGTLYFVGSILILLSARNQRLGDLAAGTLVLRERRAADRLAAAAPARAAPTGAFDVSAITSNELATVRRFLERRIDLDDRAREGLAAQLAERLRPKVLGAPAVDAESFLEWLASAKASRR